MDREYPPQWDTLPWRLWSEPGAHGNVDGCGCWWYWGDHMMGDFSACRSLINERIAINTQQLKMVGRRVNPGNDRMRIMSECFVAAVMTDALYPERPLKELDRWITSMDLEPEFSYKPFPIDVKSRTATSARCQHGKQLPVWNLPGFFVPEVVNPLTLYVFVYINGWQVFLAGVLPGTSIARVERMDGGKIIEHTRLIGLGDFHRGMHSNAEAEMELMKHRELAAAHMRKMK